jgi:two-component system chemotaxis sensor kinase CheA
MVKSGGEKFAIPQVKLVQLVRIEKNETQNKIEFLQGSPMFRLRDVLLPLIDLRNVVHKNSTGIKQGDVTNIVILSVEKEYFGLIVDEILDTTDIVVKPLSSFLKHLIMFSGATILGDGTIALILDVIGIATTCKINTKKNLTDEQHLKAIEQRKLFTDTQEFLLFELDNGVIHSIPLCLINRLEEFSIKDIEQTGDQKVVRYRGTILPILSLNQILGYSKKSAISVANEKLPVLVIQKSGKLYGVEVNEIQDIVTIDQQIDDSIRDRPGILGNLIHQQKVVAVVDALGLIEQVVTGKPLTRSTTIEEIRTMNREMKNKKLKILFADDVVFFRRHVSKVLTDAGYDITLAEDGKRALEIIDSSGSDHFNVIISDIEMPNMDGLSFARELRKRPKYKTTPLIALTTRFRDKDIEDGMKAGFDTYLEKLNPEKLLSAVSSMLGGNA